MKERQARLAGFEGDISELSENRQGILGEVQASLTEARRQGLGRKESLRQEGSQGEASLMEQVKGETDAEWARIEQKIKADMAKARKSLKAQIQSFAQSLAVKILGRELS